MLRAIASARATEISSAGPDESNFSSIRSRTSRTASQALMSPAIGGYFIHLTSVLRRAFLEVRLRDALPSGALADPGWAARCYELGCELRGIIFLGTTL